MSTAHHRKKQPLLVRQQLLEVAARLASEKGMTAVTLDAVSGASGVSKGGLLHHFPNKNTLLEALFDSLIERLDRAIEEEMRADPLPHGRFTRGYLRACLALRDQPEETKDWAQVTMMLLSEPQLRQRWLDWVRERSEEYVGTDSSVDAAIVRLATDGIWLADLLDSHAMDESAREKLVERLIELTQL
ncbi:TetR/AcrR family transcriptional regulator [Agrobacterium rhizogenes]|uniref:Transcriptional regulator protein n=1 Tax=Rhizobium rhizogenes (strain K84 / ATCC BAA-868) TaxID=311403 RepID=B9J849_RHIR8|nr:TetR/AcrR family transcriptional regulator [Rhizobium rhizogenes]ACM27370.1 transcriptional regulator protein [Rhizobium rhizogenes K84]KAA6484759.1 TetR/AcrR family transcriptional regulator [Agrobacterium sp. ICMP 7243]MDJ1637153.1 TetR/AcrR family transcriptional regulator [Rhizobium rhizogenes]NTF49340.1 TetR/AcrR family transcriptional regulator [Rhizobium rhizogenes]NTF62342.1 TetR/AcrR family transcriptional regulator [Rhizobium rhizogenes]